MLFSLCLPYERVSRSKFFPFRVDPFLQGLCHREVNWKSQKLFPDIKVAEIHAGVTILFKAFLRRSIYTFTSITHTLMAHHKPSHLDLLCFYSQHDIA